MESKDLGQGSEKEVTQNKMSTEASQSSDPFDIDTLKLPQNYANLVGVEKVITTVPCRKPNRQEFFRVHPSDDYRLETAVFEDKLSRETYLVIPELMTGELSGEVKPVSIFTCINRQSDVFLWPAKLPTADGKSNSWNDSALEAARLARDSWVRVAANMGAGYYDTFAAQGELPEPEWPDITLQDLIRIAFRDHMISSPDHPVLRSLRGEG